MNLYGRRRRRRSRRRNTGHRGKSANPIVVLVVVIILLPAFLGSFSPLLSLLPLLFTGWIIWIIVKSVRDAKSKKDGVPPASSTAETGHPAADTQALPAPQSSVLAENKAPTLTPSGAILPRRDYFRMDESGINYYWAEAFYKNLESFTGTNITYTSRSLGLIYYYLVDGQVRYIGQTRENTLKWRMNKPQADGRLGYNLYIKRNMLQAASEGRLSIRTIKVLKSQLDQYEKAEIGAYAPTSRLWNKEHNPHFKKENFYL